MNYVGVDLERSYLIKAKRNSRESNFVRADLRAIPFRPSTATIVCAVSILEHVNEVQKVISEVTEILMPGGYFAIQIPNSYFPLELHTHIPFFWFIPSWIRKRIRSRISFHNLRPNQIREYCTHLEKVLDKGYWYPREVTGLPEFFKLPIPFGYVFLYRKSKQGFPSSKSLESR